MFNPFVLCSQFPEMTMSLFLPCPNVIALSIVWMEMGVSAKQDRKKKRHTETCIRQQFIMEKSEL